MRVFFPVIFSLVFITIISLSQLYLLKKLHRDWWNYPIVRFIGRGVPIGGALAIGLWTAGIFADVDILLSIGAFSASAVLIIGISLLLSLPVSGFFHWVAHAFRRSKEERKAAVELPETSSRRRFLKTASVIVPGITVVAGSKGLANSFHEPATPQIPLYYPDLPVDLDGLRILHISDVHLGLFIDMHELERMVEIASQQHADIVLITGDFSDDAIEYYNALMLVNQIPSKYGTFASIGNHEYFRGIKQIFRAYERSPVPLLLNSGVSIPINNSILYLSGADDPRTMGSLAGPFFEESIDMALDGAPSEAFHLLMSHRPEGFMAASKRGVDLTLAGHTHGGQIGLNGRSVMEWFGREYMWGLYERNGSKLYTSAGAGHWFPFRLGCPAEMPVYVLRKG
jgi:uncharacterized protein